MVTNKGNYEGKQGSIGNKANRKEPLQLLVLHSGTIFRLPSEQLLHYLFLKLLLKSHLLDRFAASQLSVLYLSIGIIIFNH